MLCFPSGSNSNLPMTAGIPRSILRWSGRLALVVSLVVGFLAGWQWLTSKRYSIHSRALQESRTYRVFNERSNGPVIYSLDGDSLRNSLAPAVLFSFAATLRGQALPKLVAVHSNVGRDRDFRPLKSTPTYWRPKIAGRSTAFDNFLLGELVAEIEKPEAKGIRRYLMGHSLSGLYALDLATREPERFAGIFTFAPTFSHDTSIGERLPKLCHAGTSIYANWGLESLRDTAVFDVIVTQWNANIDCRQNTPATPRHLGSLHQTIMLTGQFHVAFWLLE
jgi:Putative esterase